MSLVQPEALGRPDERVDARAKVTGAAHYAYEHPVRDVTYGWIVGATVARGTIIAVDVASAAARPGVLTVIWHENAGTLAEVPDAELAVLQSGEVAYYGQPVAVVVAETFEAARDGARHLTIEYDEQAHRSAMSPDDPDLYAPDALNAGFETDTSDGDAEQALAAAAFTVDHVYETPPLHNQPMEPHAAIAQWDGDSLTIWDSTQSVTEVASTAATLFGLDADRVHVHSQYIGGGFGAKGSTRPHVPLAALAAREVGRAVKIALTREMTFHFVGYRTPTRQRVRLGAEADGRITVIAHETIEQTSRIVEFAEQTGESTRHMYAAPNRLVTHRLVRLDVPSPRWMRAPGEAPGMFAGESAIDELAREVGLDPIELRVLNEPAADPATGTAFSSRHYVDCMREGARRFGWDQAYEQRVGDWAVGHGVAGSTYPAMQMPSTARVEVNTDGAGRVHYTVSIAAADIGQGARTVLRQIAADALGVPVDVIELHMGDSALPTASVAGGSAGTASWGSAITKAARVLRSQLGRADHVPAGGLSVTEATDDDIGHKAEFARFAYGAQFVEVHVNVHSGEVRVPRAVGVFAVGRVLNPRLARSQFLGGMTMGLGMALTEEGIMDHAFADTMNDNFADYHVPANADIGELDVSWLDERDDHLTPMGGKGIGEIGIVGTAAAVANAVYDATGVRVRELPVRLDRLTDWVTTRH